VAEGSAADSREKGTAFIAQYLSTFIRVKDLKAVQYFVQ